MFKCECNCGISYDISCVIVCSSCKLKFSYVCCGFSEVNFKKLNKSNRKKWKCAYCKKADSLSNMSVSTIEFKDQLLKEVRDIFKAEIQLLKEDIVNANRNVGELRLSVDLFSNKIDEFSYTINSFKNEYSEIKKENLSLKTKIADLEKQVVELQQYSRANNLEIHGIPKTKNENVFEILKDTSKCLKLSNDLNGVNAAHRINNAKNKDCPPIIVSFVSRLIKEEWMAKFKDYRKNKQGNLMTTHINKNLKEYPVFFNHQLSPYYKNLLYECKVFAKENNFKYCWVSNGRIYVRKNENERAYRIIDSVGLAELKKKFATCA